MADVFEKLQEIRKKRQNTAFCLVVSTQGSTPRQIGAKMLVFEDGKIFGTIGGGAVEQKVIGNALDVMRSNKPQTYRYDLLKENMCCGGSMAIYIEPIMAKNKLYIFGAGHTGGALAKFALNFEFDIYIIDDRKEYLDNINLENVTKVCGVYKDLMPQLNTDEQTFIAVMTYSHAIDREILAHYVSLPYGYLGMIGSQRKVEITKRAFVQEGICTDEELKNVDMPMGISIGAEGPDEIAISILAKMIAVKNKVELK